MKKNYPPGLRSELAELHTIITGAAWLSVVWLATAMFHMQRSARFTGIAALALFATAIADYMWIQSRWPEHFEDGEET